MTAIEIRRIINNQKQQHTPHAFRAGSAGMTDFNQLHPLLRRLPERTLARHMKLIDRMWLTHEHCEPCYCKILAYCILFTADRLPERHAEYERLYRARISGSRRGRDYMREVLDSLLRQIDHPNAKLHKQYWVSVADEMARSRQHPGCLATQAQAGGKPPR